MTEEDIVRQLRRILDDGPRRPPASWWKRWMRWW